MNGERENKEKEQEPCDIIVDSVRFRKASRE
jgi:hypothetical protein